MSCRVTRSGKKYAAPESMRREKIRQSPSSGYSKTARKRLGLWASDVEASTLTEDSVLEQIFKLSPVSPVKRSRENIKPSVSLCRGIISPLKALSIRSPNSRKHEGVVQSTALQNRLNSVFAERKLNLENCRRSVLKSPTKNGQNASPKASEKILKSPKRQIEGSKTQSPSPSKKSRPEKDGNDENKSPVHSPQKCSPKRVPEFRTRIVLRELQNQTEPKPIIDDVIIQPPPPPVAIPIPDEVKAVRTHQPKKLDKTNVFNSVKNALHNSVPKRLIGRTSEIQEINDFINHHAEEQTAGSLYISGAPGTGKTACLSQVLSSPKISANFEKCISINCMSVRTASQIYQQIASEMGATSRQCKSARQALKFIENNLTTRDTMILLLLDEMDQLDSRNQEVLYTMFGWSALTDSKVILIGIANSLDLTDRILPRLQARVECKPKLINFKPYSKDQLVEILQARIAKASISSGDGSVIDNIAVQFCARKVAATTGDARKALDVCRRAVELAETDSLGNSQAPKSQKVGIRQISTVINGVYESANLCPQDGDTEQDDTFPLQQKLIVCALLLLCKKHKCHDAALGKLHETYSSICKDRQVPAVSQSEFFSLCQLVEARGIISVKKNKQIRQTKIKLNVQEKDVEFALKGKALLSSILQRGLTK